MEDITVLKEAVIKRGNRIDTLRFNSGDFDAFLKTIKQFDIREIRVSYETEEFKNGFLSFIFCFFTAFTDEREITIQVRYNHILYEFIYKGSFIVCDEKIKYFQKRLKEEIPNVIIQRGIWMKEYL